MSILKPPSKVVLLHNHDNTWTEADLVEVADEIRFVKEALQTHDYYVEDVKVYDSVTQPMRAHGYDPEAWIVFNWCEGYADRPWDYDAVAEELDQLKFTYTGAGVWSLRISRDKWKMRQVLAEAGVPMAWGALARQVSDLNWSRYPAIVKPINQHSSYGIDRDAYVEDEQQLRRRVEFVLDTFHAPALVEEYIDGREFQMTVWGNYPPTVLPAGELDFSAFPNPRDRIYTYESKFDYDSPGMNRIHWLCPAMLEVQARRHIKQACLQAYRALRCRDYARLDIRLRDGQPYVVDVNANPDINSGSIVVMAAQAAGMIYDDMVAQIVRFAAERWVRGRRRAKSIKRTQERTGSSGKLAPGA
jgi:D-alanine-D-alanine ligase